MAVASPSSSLLPVTSYPRDFSASLALAITTAVPAKSSISTSLRLSPTAITPSRVTPLAKFADRDNPQSPIEQALGAAGAKEYGDAYRTLIVGSQLSVVQGIADASFDPSPDAVYRVLVLSLVHVTPGHNADYANYIKNDLLPIQKQGQVKRYLLNQVVFGGDPNEYRTASFMDKFADLDGGPATVRVLGPEGAAKLAQKTAGIVTSVERRVYLRNEALSFRVKPTT